VAIALLEQVPQKPLAFRTQRSLAMPFNHSGPLINPLKHHFSASADSA
jgi:hypothetical protein